MLRRVRFALLAVAASLLLPASALAWGGTYPTGDTLGTSVHVDVSDAYPVDPTLPQAWATFLGTLVHGPELASLTLKLAPIDEVEHVCGPQALACYDPDTSTIEASPEDQLGEPPAREVVTHEYGHHIANNRNDAPWSAEDYGTKRWATYEHICSRVEAGSASPGAEGDAYMQNPGEAFAETYRVLNLRKEGQSSIGWSVVDLSFYPDDTALSLLEQDVTSPWTGPTTRHVHGSFGFGSQRTIAISTPLDGSLAVRLHAPTSSTMRLALYAGTKLVARASRSIAYRVCGSRALTLKVERTAGSGAFTVDISKP
jgi:hypothetical protein